MNLLVKSDYCDTMTKSGWDASKYDTKLPLPKKWVVTITNPKKENRKFAVFSMRAAQVLIELVKIGPYGNTMVEIGNALVSQGEGYKDDSKGVNELAQQSGFKSFLDKNKKTKENPEGTRKKKNARKGNDVWVLNLELLWQETEARYQKDPSTPITLNIGVESKTATTKFLPDLKKHGYVCNITGYTLIKNPSREIFLEQMRKEAIDHRRPEAKGGETKLYNLQLLSNYVNEQKRNICNVCSNIIGKTKENYEKLNADERDELSKCDECALAFPEKISTIYPTKEDISYFSYLAKNRHKNTSEVNK